MRQLRPADMRQKEKGTGMHVTRLISSCAVLALVMLMTPPGVQPTAAQSDELKAVMRIEAAGQPAMDMEYYLGDDRMRLDVPQGMSVISTSGANPRVLMVQHQERRYIEWGADQLRMMQQMLQRIPGRSGDQSDEFDPGSLNFERTGATGPVGPWNAFEVRMTNADGEEGALWITTDADIGLFEVSLRLAESASALQMPMAGSAGAAEEFLRYRSVAESQGLPDGKVVRIVSGEDDEAVTITLMSVELGTLPSDTFEPPAGYERMQMPSIPGLR